VSDALGLGSVQVLRLDENSVSLLTATALAEAFKEGVCPSLRVLSLSGNQLCDEGTAELAQVRFLGPSTHA
jgi:hypothetical protein